MEGTGKKVGVKRKKENGKRERMRKGRHEGEGEEIVHGHGAGDTGVITRPRGRSGSSVCISPNSLCFALKLVLGVLERILGLARQTSPRIPTKAMCGEEDWWEGWLGGVTGMWRIHCSSARRV